MTVAVLAEGLTGLQTYFDGLPDVARRAARLAVNDTTRKVGYREAQRRIMEQVAFPGGYLDDPKRLRISKFATEDDLEAAVFARQRPTSLARFSAGGSIGKAGVRVQVARGVSREMGRAFLLRLPQGRNPVSDEAFNLGLAIRLRPGETISRKSRMVAVPAGGGLYFLYGPSVEQVFSTVAQDISPEIAEEMATQFFRQFTRLSGDA
jgi:hypothetical protein